MTSEVIRGSRRAHARAICASDWPRPAATSASPRSRATFSSVSTDSLSEPYVPMRAPSGTPSRYLSVSRPCASAREADAADALVLEHVEQLVLHPAVEHRVGRLVDEQRRAQLAQDARRLAGALRAVRGDADVARLPRAHGGVEGAHRLLERRVGVGPVRVEDVDVVQAQAAERLVQAREQVLARAQVAVRARPHVPAGLGRDDELVAVGPEVLAQDAAGVDLGAAVGRAVVVGQVEVRDAQVERACA